MADESFNKLPTWKHLIPGDPLAPAGVVRLRGWIAARLKINPDPEAIPGICYEPPGEGIRLEIVGRTGKLRGVTPKKYRCSFCGNRDKFWTGWICLCSDGQLRLIGQKVCGKHQEELRLVVQSARQRYTESITRKHNEWLFPELRNLCIDLTKEIRACAEDGLGLSRFDWASVRRDFQQTMPELFRHIVQSASQGYALTIEKRVTDALATQRSHSTEASTPTKLQAFVIHNIAGTDWLGANQRPGVALADVVKRLYAAHRNSECVLSELTDGQLNFRLSKLRAACNSAARQVLDVIATTKSVRQFFSDRNIKGICSWANHADSPLYHSFEFTAATRGIDMVSIDSPEASFRLSASFSVPEFPAVSRLIDLLNSRPDTAIT